MKWPMVVFRWAVAALLVLGSGYAVARHVHDGIGGRYGHPQVLAPAGAPRALVLVFPDADTPQRARAAARQLAADGALVAVVDTASYLHALGQSARLDCATLADDAERLGKKLLRARKVDAFLPPLLLGDGEGARVVRQALASAAPGVLAGGVAVDDAPADDHLACSAAPASNGLQLVAASGADGGALAAVARAHFPAADSTGVGGLPLVEMPVAGSHRMAIVISGDGGWRELDKGISAELNRQGVSVVGWNSLRYFWSEKPPARIAADLARVMATYQQRWHADDVALVGYSFGADVMPFAYRRLPPAQRDAVHFVSLLGLAHGADFRVRVGGWLGLGGDTQTPILPEIAAMPPALLQCIHGEQEKDTLCPALKARGIAVVARPGGHHFDHDPVKLAAIVLQGWAQATAAAAPAAPLPVAASNAGAGARRHG